MLSKHNDATAASLQTLAFDDEVDIRSRVAERANLPEETRALLALLGQLPAQTAHSEPSLPALNTTALRTLSSLGETEGTEQRGHVEHTEKQGKPTENTRRMVEIANVSAYLGAKFRETTQSLPQRWIAAHPLVPESVLAEAVVSHDWHVREAAARNPSITLQIAAIALLDSDKDVRIALALNSSCPPELLSILQTDSHEGVREATSKNPLSHETEPHVVQLQTRRLLNKLAKQNPAIRRVLARIPGQSVSEQRAFALDAQWEVRLACASNPETDASVLALLCVDPDVDVRKAVGAHRNLSAVTRIALLGDEQPAVREALITHADDDALHRLSGDDSVTVRAVVASNPRATIAILARLSEDNDASVREFVALHPKTPLGARVRLAASEEPGVKRAVLKWASEASTEGQRAAPRPGERAHQAEPEIRQVPRREQTQVIAVLLGGNAGDAQTWERLREGDPTLNRAKLHRLAYATDWGSESFIGPKTAPNALTVLATFNDWRLRQAVARHPATPEQTIALLTRDSDYDVRSSAAAHPRLRQRDLKRLSIDPHFAVRLAIVERPETPQSVLDAMVFDDTDHVREAVLTNPQLSKEALALHDGVIHGTFVTQRALTKLAKGNSMLRKLIAAHPLCPAKLRVELARDDDWRIREAVANNECTESEVLESMGEDSDRDVRGAVARHANTPLPILVKLSGDTDHSVRTAVLANPKLVESQRQACLVSAYRRTLISELPTDRIASLLSPLCSARHLNRRSTWQSPQWLERFVAASHPLVTGAVLDRLCRDAHTAVFQQANSSMMQREPLAGAKPSADAKSTPKGSVGK